MLNSTPHRRTDQMSCKYYNKYKEKKQNGYY